MLGAWDLDEIKGCNLPQKVASAFTAVTGELVGADYQPVLYVGKQVVNGTNYCVLAIQRIIAPASEKRLVKVVINESTTGKASLVCVSGVAL